MWLPLSKVLLRWASFPVLWYDEKAREEIVPFAELGDGFITVTTVLTDRDRMLLIPGSSYQRDGTWKAPLSWASCIVLRGVFGSELQLGPGLVSWAAQERKRVSRAMELREALELPESAANGSALIDKVEAESGTGLRLLPFQRVDVAFLVLMQTAGLFQPMGAGKSAVSIRTLQVLKAAGLQPFPAAVIAPNSVKATVWPRELQRWAPELTFTVIDGGAAVRRKQIASGADILICNWEAVALHSRVAGYGDIRLTEKDKQRKELNEVGLRTVICDEAARLRVADSKQSRAVSYLLERAFYRFALTGTPVNDNAFDLWGILHAIAPDWHPGKTRYGDRFVNTGYSLYGGLTVLGLKADTEEEFRKVTQPLYRRLPKEVILPQLPPKLEPIIRHTPMTPKQAKAYQQMEKDQLAQLNDILVAGNQLSVLTRLMQFASASASVEYKTVVVKNTDGTEDERQKAIVTLEEPSSKVDDLIELLDELGPDEPLVVGAVSSQLVNIAAARLKGLGIPHGLVTGAQSGGERAEAVRAFQAGELRVILLTLGAGAEGLTLTRARFILAMQEDWRPDLNDQFYDRVHRIGSEHHAAGIQIIKQATPGTVEERKALILDAKHTRIEEVLQDKPALARLLGAR
jgi:SNF2 family DNA or RNA helicase